jgi:endonuclease YncB( thermonuclease family)
MYKRVRVKTRLRIKGIEGGERITPQGRSAMARLEHWLHDRETQDKWLIGDPGHVDQYGRIVCDVGFENGESLVALMLRSGYWWTRSRSGVQKAPTPTHD